MGIMEPILQEIITVDHDNDMVMVKSAKGNIYPVDMNHYCKSIDVGDQALVTKSLSGEWILVDVEPKYPRRLDVTEFPRDENNCLNVVEHCKYLNLIKDLSDKERVEFDNHLLRHFIEDYGMKNSLSHRRSQL